jgi:hypothetical protein
MFIQQRNTYDGQCNTAGLSKMHGLRHLYAQVRYLELTGWKAPAAGCRRSGCAVAHPRATHAGCHRSPNDQSRTRPRAPIHYRRVPGEVGQRASQ